MEFEDQQVPSSRSQPMAGASSRPGGDGATQLMDRTMEETRTQAAKAAEELKDRLSDAAGEAKTQIADAVEPLKEKAREAATAQKNTGAERLSGVARAINHAADELERELPLAASYIREAAARVDRVSASVRERSVDELLAQTDQFARRNTLAFFAGSVLAGFALSRFLKSTASRSAPGSDRRV